MTHQGVQERPSRLKLVMAFAAVYVIWGSTYLAIRYAIETLPPLLFAGMRFMVAGLLLYGWARWRGAARSQLSNWRTSFGIGGLLLLGRDCAVGLDERCDASGLSALVYGSKSLMFCPLGSVWAGVSRP